jgi:hypothetical protein
MKTFKKRKFNTSIYDIIKIGPNIKYILLKEITDEN